MITLLSREKKLLALIFLILAVLTADEKNIVATEPAIATEANIADIQGTGTKSSFVDKSVIITAIVTGDFQDNDSDTENNLGGFFIQQNQHTLDVKASSGIFVSDGKNPTIDVKVGDKVKVSGTVKEFYGETQIALSSVSLTGKGTVKPTNIYLSSMGLMKNSKGDAIANLEPFEGMLVRFPDKMTVSSLYFLGRFGEVGVVEGDRFQQFTNNNYPNSSEYNEHLDKLAERTLIIDDGLRSNNPSTQRHLHSGEVANYSIRMGDSITGAIGILRYSKGSGGSGKEGWRLEPTTDIIFKSDNPRPGKPEVAGSIKVASFNVLNFFSTIDDGKATCSPLSTQRCRGADTKEELSRQLDKIVSALSLMDSDIIGLIELENNQSESISMIVDALNKRINKSLYGYINTGIIETDAIKIGYIYKTSTVKTVGSFAMLTTDIDSRFNIKRHRPALAQTFKVLNTEAKLTVILNHLKSKGSSCKSSNDPNIYDGQGNCNLTRSNAALALSDWINSDPTKSGDKDYLIIGDLNAYTMESPLTILQKAGFTNLLKVENGAYSYIYNAQKGALDHALVSDNLLSQVTGILEWHINADEPTLLDYNLEYERDPALFDRDSPYRSSDHDPIIVGLELIK